MKRVLLTIIFISLFIPSIYAQEYGEDSDALGQYVDEFVDLNSVSVVDNVVRNSTYNAMELNKTDSGGEPIYQNLTSYTETDASNDLTVALNRVDFNTMRRDAASRITKDFGVDYFGDFEHQFTFVFSDIEAGDTSQQTINFIYALTNAGTGASGIFGGDAVAIEIGQQTNVDDRFRFRLIQNLGGINQFASFGNFRNIGTYYITIDRSGTVLRLRVYSDLARLNLIETITDATTDTTAYRYAEFTIGYTGGADPADYSTGYVDVVWFGETGAGYLGNGYFTTINYLSDPLANGSILVQMTNTTIPDDTVITVEFSLDNSSWILNDWQPIFGGFESIDLRDLNYSTSFYIRYNLTTTDGTKTPRVYQSRLITTIGNASTETVFQNVTGAWTYHNLTSISTLVGTLDSGNLASTLDIDSNEYNVSETVGNPGFLISFNWTNIDDTARCLWVTMNVLYDGNLAHDIHIELYNHTSLSWVEIGVIDDDIAYEWHNVTSYTLRVPNDFVNGTGSVFGRLNHNVAGNINHDLSIEYLKLLAFIPSSVSVIGGINSSVIIMIIFLCGLAVTLLWRFTK